MGKHEFEWLPDFFAIDETFAIKVMRSSGQPMYPKTFGKMTHPTDALSRNFMQADESWS